MNLTVEALAKEIVSAAKKCGVAIYAPKVFATALLPFIERHIAAGQQGAGDYPHEQMDAIAAERYKVFPTNAGFWPFCVKAGDGEQELYKGHRNSCEAVARQLTGAFLDGGFAAAAMLAAAPAPEAEPKECPSCGADEHDGACEPQPVEMPEAERAKGEAVAWAQDTPYGRAYSFADELGKAFPGLLSAPPPAGQPADVEALATEIAHTFDRDEDGKGWVFDSAQLAELVRRLASAQQSAEDDHGR